MKLSIFTLILKEFPLPEVIKIAKEIGYEAVELMGLIPIFQLRLQLNRQKKFTA